MAKLKQYKELIFSVITCCLLHIHLSAQECKLIAYNKDNKPLQANGFTIQSTFTSKQNCLVYAAQLPSSLNMEGYISVSVDSLWQDSSNVYLQVFTGEKYEWEALDINENDWITLNTLGYYKETFQSKPFQQQKLVSMYNDVLDYFANNGYPFAKVFLDSISFINNKIKATLYIDKGNLYTMDSIVVDGDTRITGNFLQHYLDIEKTYQQNKLNNINERLAQLSFFKQSQPYEVEMLNTGAILHLYLQSTATNEINVLVGLLPSNEQTGGKLLLTGEAKVALQNSFGDGEIISVNWQQLQPKCEIELLANGRCRVERVLL
ncbi:MAG: hypothetical protein ABJA79_05205, partial [Parafilimonas sp.]